MAGRTKPERVALRDEMIHAAATALASLGPDRFSVATIVDAFADRVPPTTGFRWIARAKSSGLLGQLAAREISAAAERRAAEHPGRDPIKAIADTLPVVTSLDHVAGAGGLKVIDYLNQCINNALNVIACAKKPDGTPRASKLLLGASEHLRRCLETATKIAERMTEMQRVEQFHRQILEEIREESPACHQRILARLDSLAGQWGAL